MQITEIIPDDMPEWAIKAMAQGQLFNETFQRIKDLEEALLWCKNSPSFSQDGEAKQGWDNICEPLLGA